MEEKFTVTQGDRDLGKLVAVGPKPPADYPQVMVPATSLWYVTYDALSLKVELDLVFSGERLEIQRLVASGLDCKAVQSRDLTQLALPAVIRKISSICIPHYEFWTREYQDRETRWESLKTDDVFLAQMLWVEQIGQGNPRKALMDYFAMPRSTATLVMRRLRTEFSIPK